MLLLSTALRPAAAALNGSDLIQGRDLDWVVVAM